MTQSQAGYWYINRDKLASGQIFRTLKGLMVKLDRQVEGDSAKWYVAIWHKGWANYNTTIEPSELCGPQLPEPSSDGSSKAGGRRFLVSPDGARSAWAMPGEAAHSKYAGWTNCTEMSPEQLQRHVAERQAVRPHIVGVTVGA